MIPAPTRAASSTPLQFAGCSQQLQGDYLHREILVGSSETTPIVGSDASFQRASACEWHRDVVAALILCLGGKFSAGVKNCSHPLCCPLPL